MNTDLDIRDIESGQTYWVVADDERGGRCVMNGMFIAVWLDRDSAEAYVKTNANYTAVKQVKV